MKTKWILYFLLANISFIENIYAQMPLRQVIMNNTVTKMYAVPTGTNIDLLSSFDLARIQPYEKSEKTELIIDDNNDLTITNYYFQQPRYELDYENGIGKSVTNKYGTYLYNHNGKEINNIENPTVDLDFNINNDALSSFGLFNFFEQDLSQLQNNYNSLGYNTLIDPDGVLHIISDSIEITIDPFKYIYEVRIFDPILNILITSDWKQYQKVNDMFIPKVFVNTNYEEMSNAIRLQVSEIIWYDSYSIIDNDGKIIVDFNRDVKKGATFSGKSISQYSETTKKSINVEVFPNPATEKITIRTPDFISDVLNIEIIDSKGNIVIKHQQIKGGIKLDIDITTLKSGNFIVKCGNGTIWKSTKFVKL